MSSYIDSLNQTTTAATGKSTAKTKAEATMGKEDFLKLLVAQLQNQDPLSPEDPTEFTAQLAQFSSLEQLTTLNESMDNFVTSNANSDRLSTLSTIGKDVAYTGSTFNYSGSPIELGYNLDATASSVSLILQLNGSTVATLDGRDLTVGNHYIAWDGLTSSGAQAASGKYTIILQAKAADGGSVAATPLIKSEVTGIDLGGESGGTLITKAGEIAFNAIIGVYDPSSRTVSNKTTATAAKTVEETAADIESTVDTVAEVAEDVEAVL